MVALDADRVVWESKLAPGYTFPRSFGAATRGLLRSYTRLLDLPEARVEGTSDEVLMRYVVVLPPPRTLASAWKRLAAPILAAPHDLRSDFDVAGPEEIDELLLSRPTPAEHVHELGAGLTAATSLEALGAAVLGLLEHHFLAHTAALWFATPDGTLVPAGTMRATRCDSVHSRDLVVGGRHVGRLDVDGAVLHPQGATYDEFEALLPWIAMALARLLESPPDGESALREAAQAARLTHREAEVLRWVREGRTDREIATILDISPRTVQKHVERILTKMGAETRFAAARRTFELR
jgi:DNA-binding CsgD family transcriptional regulator